MVSKDVTIKTISAIRDSLRKIALGCAPDVDELWKDVQSADQLLEELNKQPTLGRVLSDSVLVNSMLNYAMPSIVGFGKLDLLLRGIEQRHAALSAKAFSATDDEARRIAIDLFMAMKLWRDSNEDNKPGKLPGSSSESSGSGPLHEGTSRLLGDGTVKAPENDRSY